MGCTALNVPVSGKMSFVFTSDDLNKIIAELKNKGLILEPPDKFDWAYELRLKDPDGNEIVIAEFLNE